MGTTGNAMNRQDRGVVVWFTGLPSSGKTTLAHRVAEALAERSIHPVVLDGDEVRGLLRPHPGYDSASRDAFYETLGRLAGLLATQGHVVLVPATAHKRMFRARAKVFAPRFLEVYVDTPLSECARRDTKGLYAKSHAGEIEALPGIGDSYEPPENPNVTAHWRQFDDAIERVIVSIYESPQLT